MTSPTTATGTGDSGWQRRYADALMNTFGMPRALLVRGEGCYVWDEAGKCYLDLLGGIAVNALGHAHPAIVEAVTGQLGTLGHVSNFFTTEPQIQLAERLLGLLGADGRVFFANSGTEANEAALKATRRLGRSRIVAAKGAFHGRSVGALSLTHKAAYREPFEPLLGDVCWVEYGDEHALADAVDERTAAVVLEPVQGEAGVLLPPSGYLAAARRITAERGALLWLDEVQSGIGRTGRWFAHQGQDVVPDLVTVAKGLGSGIPIGACIAVGTAAGLLGPGQHGTTFGGNPVAAAAGLATLETIESQGLLGHVGELGARWSRDLASVDGVASVRAAGLLIGIQLTTGVPAKAVADAAMRAGFIVNDCTADTVRLAPPLVLSDDQADSWTGALPALIEEAS